MIEQLLTTQNYIIISAILGKLLIYNAYKNQKRTLSLLHATVVIWSGLIYTNFLYKFLPLQQTYYIDWIISTPIIVLAFGYTLNKAFTSEMIQNTVIQVGVILTGLIAIQSSQPLLWFTIGTALMLLVFYNFYQMNALQKQPLLTLILVGSFTLYPVIWWMTNGNLLEMQTALIALPLVSKHLFSILDVYLS